MLLLRTASLLLALVSLAPSSALARSKKPEAADAPLVTCSDGSSSKGGRGACKGHGGIAKGGSAAPAAPAAPGAPAPAASSGGKDAPAALVTCKDGSSSKGGRGACRGHGGVAKGGNAAGTTQAPAPASPAAVTETPPSPPAAPRATQEPSNAQAPGAGATAPGRAPTRSVQQPSAASTPATTSAAAPASAPAAPAASQSGGSVNADSTGATARCKDGTFSHSKHHSGSCSGHGGVAEFLDAAKK